MSEVNSNQELTDKAKEFVIQADMDIVGIADVNNELFLEAPESHQPPRKFAVLLRTTAPVLCPCLQTGIPVRGM